MAKPTIKHYSLEFRESSAQLAVDSDQPTSKIAKALGAEDTLPMMS
jgi:transposase-like protein